MIVILLYLLSFFALLFFLSIKHKKLILPSIFVFILLPIAYCWASWSIPAVYNFQGQLHYKKSIEKALGSHLKEIKHLRCRCINCHPAADGWDQSCSFEASSDTVQRIASDLKCAECEAKELSEAWLRYRTGCVKQGVFTKKYRRIKPVPTSGDGETSNLFYNEQTKNVCMDGFFPTQKNLE